MKRIKINSKNISIRVIIIISFIILMLTTVSLIGYIVFSNWLSWADKTITKMAEDMNDEIYHEIDTFIHIPEHITEINRGLIENGIIDMNNEIEREKFFVRILQTYSSDVYSFSYGTEKGEYYGARRNKDDIIEIMRNNAATKGHSWYYSVKEDMTAGTLMEKTKKYDPRIREWYKMGKMAQGPVFAPIYKHFVMDDLAISAATPIRSEDGELQGVLGAHITLSKIDHYLSEIVEDKKALAIIIEKDSGELVANSLDRSNFRVLQDGTISRVTLEQLDHKAVTQAYEDYKKTGNRYLVSDDGKDKLYLHLVEYDKEGLNLIIITAVPADLFAVEIMNNIRLAGVLTLVVLILSIIIYRKVANRFLSPIENLITTAEKLSQGDLSQRAVIARNDEIGMVAKVFNKMADTLCMLVNNLEVKVKERTIELEVKNNELKENKDQLQLLLDSTVEGIYGMDTNGNCTFCNASGLKMLGYSQQEDLLGKDIHLQIHHTTRDKRSMPLVECKIYKALLEGRGIHVDDEVFWRADGTSFDVEYYSYPQYKDGEVVGVVVTFMDNTERKKNQEYIKYLSYHDSLTDLYNRLFFENELKKLDTKKNLPISIIFGDVNGLKLTNDIFGHVAGDKLLKKSAEVLKRVCRETDIVARMGGDEFAIFLPNTEASDAEKIIDRIKKEFSKEQIVAIKGSISMGHGTKTRANQSIEMVIDEAEGEMYKEKMFNRKAINSDMVETIIGTLHSKSFREKHHSIAVSELCQNIGEAMKLPETEVRKLKEAGFLHDIGKIILDEDILKKEDILSEEENKQIQQHAVVGFRILDLFEDTLDLAEGVLSHHENWDGSGYPKGLKGEEIPRLARIIKLAESYDTMINSLSKSVMSKEEALQEIKRQAGVKFDPDIVEIFIQMMTSK